MKLSNKLIEEVVLESAGSDALELVKLIKSKKNVSEFKIADLMELDVNVVRNKLYRLYDNHLVTFIRRKDKKKGWYIYYWTFNKKRVKYLYFDLKKKKLEKLKDRLSREKSNYFFSCKDKCMRIDFDQATDFEYKCPECGKLLDQEDNSQKIHDIEHEINHLEKEIAA